MEITADAIHNQIPYYLTQHQKDGLVKALSDFQGNHTKPNYYINRYVDQLMQGDGWSDFQIFNFENGEKASILGIALSNTCDVTPENNRDLPVKITFAPVIPLSAYNNLLRKNGINEDKISNKMRDIRAQKITNIFYLPCGSKLQEEHIALLSDVHTMPAVYFQNNQKKCKSFTLSMFGFYLFVFKLSIHFCRFHENVDRS